MNKKDIEELKKTIKLEYINKVKFLEDELKQTLDVLERIEGRYMTKIDSPLNIKPTINVSEEVRKAIDSLIGVFSIREIRNMITKADPAIVTNMSHAVLKKLVNNGDLVVMEKGKGRRPTTYLKNR